ncbi:hypothetical protein [Embleya sp. AB8]|uniref:hypothetical protein n=1 Tax=Embleya sp. AB8 TaxID=3156304 RepID=UPI003C74FDFC
MALSRIKRATLAAAAGVAVLGGTLAAAAPASASALSCDHPVQIQWNGGGNHDSFCGGTNYGTWWGTQGIIAGNHSGVALCNDQGRWYNLQFNSAIKPWWPTDNPNDECTEVWIAS